MPPIHKLLFATAIISLSACGGGSASGGAATVVLPPSPTPTPTPAPTPTPTPTGVERPHGVFALAGRGLSNADKAALLALPYVDGMTSYVSWNDIEPVKGLYDFTRLDNDIALARAAGKKLTFAVFTGNVSLPPWLAADGVRTWTTSQGNILVHPADARFVTLWSERIAALGARYDNDPTVVQVGICGAAGTLCGPRYPELPGDVTYAQLVSAWTPIIAAYNAAFPNTYKHLEVHLTTNGLGATLPVDLFSQVGNGAAIGPFAEFLNDVNPSASSTVGVAFTRIKSTRSWCGFQMVGPVADKVDEAIMLGRSYGCTYFEVYNSDALTYGADITRVRATF